VDGDHRCTENPDYVSQCTAKDSDQTVWIDPEMNDTMTTALTTSINGDYDPITGVTANVVTLLSAADVWVVEYHGGAIARRGYGVCADDSTQGDSGRNRWCRPQVVFLNNEPHWS